MRNTIVGLILVAVCSSAAAFVIHRHDSSGAVFVIPDAAFRKATSAQKAVADQFAGKYATAWYPLARYRSDAMVWSPAALAAILIAAAAAASALTLTVIARRRRSAEVAA